MLGTTRLRPSRHPVRSVNAQRLVVLAKIWDRRASKLSILTHGYNGHVGTNKHTAVALSFDAGWASNNRPIAYVIRGVAPGEFLGLVPAIFQYYNDDKPPTGWLRPESSSPVQQFPGLCARLDVVPGTLSFMTLVTTEDDANVIITFVQVFEPAHPTFPGVALAAFARRHIASLLSLRVLIKAFFLLQKPRTSQKMGETVSLGLPAFPHEFKGIYTTDSSPTSNADSVINAVLHVFASLPCNRTFFLHQPSRRRQTADFEASMFRHPAFDKTAPRVLKHLLLMPRILSTAVADRYNIATAAGVDTHQLRTLIKAIYHGDWRVDALSGDHDCSDPLRGRGTCHYIYGRVSSSRTG